MSGVTRDTSDKITLGNALHHHHGIYPSADGEFRDFYDLRSSRDYESSGNIWSRDTCACRDV